MVQRRGGRAVEVPAENAVHAVRRDARPRRRRRPRARDGGDEDAHLPQLDVAASRVEQTVDAADDDEGFFFSRFVVRSAQGRDRRGVRLQAALHAFEIDRLEVDALERVAAEKHAAPVELAAAAGRVRAAVPAPTELRLKKREALVLLQQKHVRSQSFDLLHQNGATASSAHRAHIRPAVQLGMFRCQRGRQDVVTRDPERRLVVSVRILILWRARDPDALVQPAPSRLRGVGQGPSRTRTRAACVVGADVSVSVPSVVASAASSWWEPAESRV